MTGVTDQSGFHGCCKNFSSEFIFGRKRFLCLAIGDKFNACEQATATDISYIGMIAKCALQSSH